MAFIRLYLRVLGLLRAEAKLAVTLALAAAGIAAGLHTYSFFVAKDSRWVTPVPDPRLGERACAFVVLRDGEHLDFDAMVAYLEQQQLARQYFPEYLEVLPQMPMTVSGKIQKFQLREMAKSSFCKP